MYLMYIQYMILIYVTLVYSTCLCSLLKEPGTLLFIAQVLDVFVIRGCETRTRHHQDGPMICFNQWLISP